MNAKRHLVALAGLSVAVWLASPGGAWAAQFHGYLRKDTSGCCTIHGTRVSIEFDTWATQASNNYQAVRVVALNSDGSVHVQTGAEGSFGEAFEGCTATGGEVDSFVEWNDGTNEGCARLGFIGSGTPTHTYKVIRQCASCNVKWRMYVDQDLKSTSNALFSNPDNVRAGGQSDASGIGSFAFTDYGTTVDWGRTAQSDDQSVTWTTITNEDATSETGDWQVGTLPDPFNVNNQ